ncbi:MAG: single-stranded-DNA-specific exonuclease RecJ [FCB group bacterium]
MNYRWTFRKRADESIIQGLVSSLNVPKSLAQVLIARGVFSKEDAKRFFEPALDDLHDPFLMDGMDIAVERILHAINKKEAIWIHGDYDVDGTASTSMMLQFLREVGAEVNYYIPDRFKEGYGLSVNSVQKAKKRNTKLIITVDVGITSYEAIDYANSIDMDVIICDHHEPGDIIPKVLTILDPLKPGCNYPFKNLAACGVAFKLVQGLANTLNIPEKAYEYLDFVAISSAADMVPLIGENRTLVYYGLELINNKPRPGIKGLIDCTRQKLGSINTSTIIYSLAPLINAAGRLGDARRSVDMMTQKDETVAFQIAQKLEQENRRRRIFDEQTFEETIPMAEKLLKDYPWRSLVLHAPHWHAGVIGIVASRLVDRFHLPTVLLTTIDNLAKGSARSIHDFDIHRALKTCGHLLIEYGGHKHAAGLTLKEEDIVEFRESLEKVAETRISSDMLIPEIVVDAELKLYELSPVFLDILNKFAPYGFDNNKPIFFSEGVTSANGVKIVGKNHLKFRAYQSFEIDAIGYNLGDKIDICTNGKPFSMLFNIEENLFNGHSSTQLRIKDIRTEEALQ